MSAAARQNPLRFRKTGAAGQSRQAPRVKWQKQGDGVKRVCEQQLGCRPPPVPTQPAPPQQKAGVSKSLPIRPREALEPLRELSVGLLVSETVRNHQAPEDSLLTEEKDQNPRLGRSSDKH